MDWVHCNHCFLQPGNVENRQFLMTNCGHIYCAQCIEMPELKQCLICQRSYRTMLLSSQMNKEVELYFRNPIEDIQKLVKVLEFQQSHRNRLTACNREKLAKYKILKNECSTLKEKLKHLQEENLLLQDELKRIKTELFEYKHKVDDLTNHNQFHFQTMNPEHGLLSSSGSPAHTISHRLIRPDTLASSAENRCNLLKRPSGEKNLFRPSSRSGSSNTHMFTPITTTLSGSNRSVYSLPHVSPITPNTYNRENSEKTLTTRKLRLLGDKGNPSPAIRAAFHRLTLSKLTSTPKQDSSAISRYSQYFKK